MESSFALKPAVILKLEWNLARLEDLDRIANKSEFDKTVKKTERIIRNNRELVERYCQEDPELSQAYENFKLNIVSSNHRINKEPKKGFFKKILRGKGENLKHLPDAQSTSLSSLLNFESKQNELLFVLLHTDFLNLNLHNFPSNPIAVLPSLIRALNELVKLPWLDSVSQEKLQTLIAQYEDAYDNLRMLASVNQKRTPGERDQAVKEFQAKIFDKLYLAGQTTISTGYAAQPAGHAVALQLELREDGRIQGVVINGGEGLLYHGTSAAEGTALKYSPYLNLEPVSPEELAKTPFFKLLTELSLTHFQEKETHYSIEDFYQVVIPSWPGAKSIWDDRNTLRKGQRGGTCSIKPFMIKLKDTFDEDTALRLKFELKKYALENYLETSKITLQNCQVIESSLQKLNRSAIKANLIDQERDALNKWSEEIFAKIKKTHAEFAAQASAESAINLIAHEPEAYTFRFPKLPKAAKRVDPGTILPPCDKNHVDTYLNAAEKIIHQLLKSGLAGAAKKVAYQVLENIPPPSDEFWKEGVTEKQLATVHQLSRFLIPITKDSKGALIIPAHGCVLLMKTFLITIMAAKFKFQMADALILNYLDVIDGLMVASPKFIITLRKDLEEFESYVKELQELSQSLQTQRVKIKQNIARIGSRCFVDNISDIKNIPELNYIHEKLENLPSADKSRIKRKIASCYRSNAAVLTALFYGGWVNLDPTTEEENSEYERYFDPIFILLRRQNILFQLAFGDWKWPASEFIRFSTNGNAEGTGRTLSIDFNDDSSMFSSLGEGLLGKLLPESWDPFYCSWIFQMLAKEKQNINFKNLSPKGASIRGYDDAVILISSEEQIDLLNISAEGKMVVPQLINYFSRHFQHIKDGSFQALLVWYLFTRRSANNAPAIVEFIDDALPEGKKQLQKFLENSITKSRELHWLETELYFTWLYAHVLPYFDDESNRGYLQHGTEFLTKKLEDFEARKDLSVELLAAITHWVVAMAPALAETSETKPLLQFCRRANALIHTEALAYPFKEKRGANIAEEFEMGIALVEDDHDTTLLPSNIANHVDYMQLFDVRYPANHLGHGVYEFTDNHGITTRISSAGMQLKILQERECSDGTKGWFQWSKQSPFEQTPYIVEGHPCWTAPEEHKKEDSEESKKGHFGEAKHYWYHVSAPHECLVPGGANNELLCFVTPTGIQRISQDKEPLFLASCYPDLGINLPPIAQAAFNFEKSGHTLIWKDSTGAIKKIEFPRYGLTFDLKTDLSTQETYWESPQHPGFMVDSCQNLPSLYPHHRYIKLKQRTTGAQVVLMPNVAFDHEQPGYFSPDKMKSTLAKENRRLLCYQLTSKGKIQIPQDDYHTLYLLYLHLFRQDYTAAFKVTTRLKLQPTKWNDELCELARFFFEPAEKKPFEPASPKNYHPAAVVMRLKLLMMGYASAQSEIKKLCSAHLTDHYIKYLNQINNANKFVLSPKEELQIIDAISVQSNLGEASALLTARKKALNGTQGTFITIATGNNHEAEESGKMNYSLLDRHLLEEMIACYKKKPRTHALMTRPGEAFVSNFLFNYELISSEDPSRVEEKQKLIEILRCSRYGKDDKVEMVRRLLIMAWKYPGLIPADDFKYTFSGKSTFLSDEACSKYFKSNFPDELWEKCASATAQMWNLQLEYSPFSGKTIAGNASLPPVSGKQKKLASTSHDKAAAINFTRQYFLYINKVDRSQISQRNTADVKKLKELRDTIYTSDDQNPCVQSEFRRYQKGINQKGKELVREINNDQFEIDLSKIDELPATLTRDIIKQTKRVAKAKRQALALARKYTPEIALEVHAGRIHPLTIKELAICLAKGMDKKIAASNPCLSTQGINELKGLLENYLVQLTDLQQMQRSLVLANTVNQLNMSGTHNPELAGECAKLAAMLSAKRAYKVHEKPELLVFEAFGDIRLKLEQVIALENITEDEIANLELEARTGFGKSKVLIPLWLLLNCQKRPLTMMTVPSSLFQDQLKHLRKTLGSAFDFAIIPMEVPLSSALDIEFLKSLNKQLKEGKEEKKLFLAPINAPHNLLILAPMKKIFDCQPEEVDLEALEELLKIKNEFANNVSNFVDESKECFDVRKRYDCALGSPKNISHRKCSDAMEFYREILLSDDILNRWNFEFLPQWNHSDKQQISEENYFSELQDQIVERALDYFQVPKKLRFAVAEDLKGRYSKKCEKFYRMLAENKAGYEGKGKETDTSAWKSKAVSSSKIKEKELEKYEYFKMQISIFLKHALTRDCDTRYGFDTETNSRLAFPLERGILNPQSQFSTIEDQINFTIQANLKHPIRPQDLQVFVQEAQLNRLEEKRNGKGIDSYLKKLEVLSGKSLMEIDGKEIEKLVAALNTPQNLDLKLEFISLAILSKITFFKEKISSSSFNFISANHEVKAASGTVYPETLPPSFRSLRSVSAPVDNLLALWKNSQNRLHTIKDEAPVVKLQGLLKSYPSHRLLTDIAGMFRELSGQKAAEIILEETENAVPPVAGVSYYDTKGNFLILERNSRKSIPYESSNLTVDQIFTFIPQSNVVGSDTAMPVTCEGINTISHKVLKDLFLQGTGRMRGLSTGQMATFVMGEGDVAVIKKAMADKHDALHVENVSCEISLAELLRYLTKEQAIKKAEDYLFSLDAYLSDTLLKQLFHLVEKRPDDSRETYLDLIRTVQLFRAVLIKKTQPKALSRLRANYVLENAKEVVNEIREEFFASVKGIIQEHDVEGIDIRGMEEEFNAYVDEHKLPLLTLHHDNDDAVDIVEVANSEREGRQEVEAEKLAEEALATPKKISPSRLWPWEGKYWETPWFDFEALEKIGGLRCYASPNYFNSDTQPDENRKLRKKADQSLLMIDRANGEISLMLLDLFDANLVMGQMKKRFDQQLNGDCDFYLLSGGKVFGAEASEELNLNKKEIKRALLIHKLCQNQFHLTREERKDINSDPDFKAELLDFVKQYYAKSWPRLAAACQQL